MGLVRQGLIDYLDADARSRGREHFGLYVDAQFRPIASYVRVAKDRRHCASGWFHFGAQHVDIVTCTDTAATQTRRLALPRAARAFGSHPPYETWVTDDGAYQLVRAQVGAPLSIRYDLLYLR
jgi:hypothetical protein